MTGQELRHELTQVNFGVKPTDREVPENLAQGIIRFIARKKNLSISQEDIDAVLHEGASSAEMQKPAMDAPAEESDERRADAVDEVKAPAPPDEGKNLNVLRKLTLEGVSAEAIARQKKELARDTVPRRTTTHVRTPQRFVAKKKPMEETHQEQIKRKVGIVELPESISVKEFAEKTGIQVPKVIQALMKNGIMATINQRIDFDTAAIIATELGVQVQRSEASVSVEALLKRDLQSLLKDEPENLRPRPPIVTVMGHVDHGKTAILDSIRSTNVVAGEAGGITQHIGAYQVDHEGKRITFLDTPGHEAFTAMRARGAQVTDIAVLVVSAEEGVKPTTIEAIDHAKDAGVPIIVAINKIDKPNADIDRVKGELAGHGLQSEDWGGTVPMVPCSALTKQGIPDLLESILIVAELKELKANPQRSAIATVIESHLDTALGPVATVIVNTGTLRMGDSIACGAVTGRVKVLLDEHNAKVDGVGPSGPARISGFESVPNVGDIVQVFKTDRDAKEFSDAYAESKDRDAKRGFADLVSRLTEGKLSQLKIVLKADTQGSLQSIEEGIRKLASADVQAKVIHAAVGAITESDVMMAAASDGIVIGFNVQAASSVHRTAEREGVEIKIYDIIYKLFEDTELLLKGLIEPEEQEVITGHLEVRGTFFTKKSEQIIGGKVTDGTLKRTPFRLLRDGAVVAQGRIITLKNVDKDIKEAKEGSECGLKVECDTTVLLGDTLEAYRLEFKRQNS